MKGNIIVALIAIVIIWVLGLFNKETKQSLAQFYDISRPTLAKWIKFFQTEIPEEQWNQKKYLLRYELQKLKSILGCDPTRALTKRQIVEESESDYKTVAAVVRLNLSKIGISNEAWESCNRFPPVISEKILEVLG